MVLEMLQGGSNHAHPSKIVAPAVRKPIATVFSVVCPDTGQVLDTRRLDLSEIKPGDTHRVKIDLHELYPGGQISKENIFADG